MLIPYLECLFVVQVLGLHWSLATPTLVQQACEASQKVCPSMRPSISMVRHYAVLTLPPCACASGAFWHPGIAHGRSFVLQFLQLWSDASRTCSRMELMQSLQAPE